MIKFVIFPAILFCFQSFAVDKIKLDSIGFGSRLNIMGSIELPKAQKLNQKAPSKITVYEQEGKDWVVTLLTFRVDRNLQSRSQSSTERHLQLNAAVYT